MKRYAALAALIVTVVVAWPAAPAQAHPLGRFSVNQYAGLTLRPDRIDVAAVVDVAELPTLQDRALADTDGDGTLSAPERAGYAQAECARLADGFTASVAGRRVVWTVSAPDYEVVPGAGGLNTSRLECGLSAAARLGADNGNAGDTGLDEVVEVRVDNEYRADRVGWRELSAVGAGVRMSSSTVPAESVTGRLSAYPQDLLTSALDVRTATIEIGGVPTAGAPGSPTADENPDGAGSPATGVHSSGAGSPTAGGPEFLAAAQQRVEAVLGGQLTPLVVGLAFLLAVLLGAGHAVLPGHGKTVMAAYFAGRRGRIRDALAVGGTVTLAHTGTVLLVGLLLSTSTALAGEQLLTVLGVASGALVILVGLNMLLSVRRSGSLESHSHTDHSHTDHTHDSMHPVSAHSHGIHDEHTHRHDPHGNGSNDHGPHDHGLHERDQHEQGVHGRDQHEHDQRGHGGHEHGGLVLGQHGPAQHEHGQHGPVQHEHGRHEHGGHQQVTSVPPGDHVHVHADHRGMRLHGHGHGHSHNGDERGGRLRRRLGLVGIGLAGGLVPSPSALVVLLGAVGLGRSGLGVALVVAYGLGMAATLTAVGLLLVVAQKRVTHLIGAGGRLGRLGGGLSQLSGRIAAGAPAATAMLVVIVGLGIGLRAIA